MTHALIAAADALLLFAIGARVVGRVSAGVAAAVLLLLTPAHVFGATAPYAGRQAVPFLLGWALALTALIDRPAQRARWMLAAGVASLLASGAAYPPAALLIPVLGAATIWAWARAANWRIQKTGRALSWVVATAVLSVLAVGAGAAALQEPAASAAVASGEWLRTVAWQKAATVSRWFWNFYLPSHLFLNPEAPGWCGMFLTSTVIPIAVGLSVLFRVDATERRFDALRVIVVGFGAGAPLAAAIASPPPLDDRALAVVPCGVLLAVLGSTRMWGRGTAGRVLLAAVFLAAAVQALVSIRGSGL